MEATISLFRRDIKRDNHSLAAPPSLVPIYALSTREMLHTRHYRVHGPYEKRRPDVPWLSILWTGGITSFSVLLGKNPLTRLDCHVTIRDMAFCVLYSPPNLKLRNPSITQVI